MAEGLDLFERYLKEHQEGFLCSAIITSLDETEVFMIMAEDDIDCKIRKLIMNRVINDLAHGNCSHEKLINLWKLQAQSSDLKVKKKGSHSLVQIVPFSKADFSRIIITFINDDCSLIRRRGKNLIKYVRDKYFPDLVCCLEQAWVTYGDDFIVKALCESASIDFLHEHYQDLWNRGASRILFKRLYESGFNIMDYLKREYPCDYLFYSAIYKRDIPDNEVLNILTEYKHSDIVNLLLWSVGYMKKMSVLRELMKPEWSEISQPDFLFEMDD